MPAGLNNINGINFKRPTNAFGEYVRMKTLNSNGPVNTRDISDMWNNCDNKTRARCEQLAMDKWKTYKLLKKKYEEKRLKRPMNGYNLFVQDFFKLNQHLYDKKSEIVVAAAMMWNGLPQSDRDDWLKEGQAEREIYYAEKERRIAAGECIGKKLCNKKVKKPNIAVQKKKVAAARKLNGISSKATARRKKAATKREKITTKREKITTRREKVTDRREKVTARRLKATASRAKTTASRAKTTASRAQATSAKKARPSCYKKRA